MNRMDIYLKSAIIHLMDRESGVPVYSQIPLDLANEVVRTYVQTKIQKVASAQTKTGQLKSDSFVAEQIKALETDFTGASQQLTEHWFQLLNGSEDAPGGDVIVALYEEDTRLYGALMKLNYKESYTHFVEYEADQVANKLIVNRAILPSKSQKPDEALLVGLNDLSYQLIEKKYQFSGEKKAYFSEQVIESEPLPSMEENIREVKKVAKKISKQFNQEEYATLAAVQEAIAESVEESGTVSSQYVAEKVFQDNVSARLAYQEELKDTSFVEEAPVPKLVAEKKFSKQKLKMDNGIELIVPLEIYHDPNMIEFINNPDGTVSITIKNVEKIINKF